jgi:hypothetical protein
MVMTRSSRVSEDFFRIKKELLPRACVAARGMEADATTHEFGMK